MNRKEKKIVWLLIYICIFILTSIIAFINIKDIKINDLNIWVMYTSIITLLNISSWKIISGKYFTPYTIFTAIAFIFWNGQTVLKSIGLTPKYYTSIYSFTNEQIVKAQIYTLMFMITFHIGAIMSTIISLKRVKVKPVDEEIYIKSIEIMAILLCTISVYPYLSNLIRKVKISITSGYMALYGYGTGGIHTSSFENIFIYLRQFFIPSLIILLFIKYQNKIYRNIILVSFAINIILSFITGGRGGSVILMIIVMWIISDRSKQIKTLHIVLFVAVSITIINLVPIISEFRIVEEKNINKFVELIIDKNHEKQQPVLELVSEMGSSMNPLIETINLVPNKYEHKLGLSYIASVVAVIPSFLMGGFSLTNEANLSEWLMNALNLDYGPGYSLVAEAYYNFSWIGILLVVPLGMFFCKMLTSKQNNNSSISTRDKAFVAIFMYVSLMCIRGSIYLLVRDIIYLIIIPKVLIKVIYTYIRRSSSRIKL